LNCIGVAGVLLEACVGEPNDLVAALAPLVINTRYLSRENHVARYQAVIDLNRGKNYTKSLEPDLELGKLRR
jgi:hypothetical protein